MILLVRMNEISDDSQRVLTPWLVWLLLRLELLLPLLLLLRRVGRGLARHIGPLPPAPGRRQRRGDATHHKQVVAQAVREAEHTGRQPPAQLRWCFMEQHQRALHLPRHRPCYVQLRREDACSTQGLFRFV